MFIEQFYQQSAEKISFTRAQASDFAKQVADDFNPLHNEDAKRFCVPGDLLFSVILSRSGLNQEMQFKFSGMVTDGIELNFPTQISESAVITDDKGKEYLQVSASGDNSTNPVLIDSLIKAYVGFSGHTFPHILCELMKKNNVMINPARPMVMYESMALHIEQLDATDVSLELSESTLTIDGKRGNALLAFNLFSEGKIIGRGEKHMVLSGLREYCGATIESISEQYMASKDAYRKEPVA